jgi:hypothetical protein
VDLSGKDVASVTRRNMSAGDKVFIWNTAGLPIGVSLLRMKSGDWVGAQKIMIAK